MSTPRVHLRAITAENVDACLALDVEEGQRGLVAPNVKSLAQAYADPALTPLAVYDAAAIGQVKSPGPMVGFVMYEVAAGVGFITRLMIDRGSQGRGYGRATMLEVLRRLTLIPEVQLIATSHRAENAVAGNLYRDLGFADWPIDWARDQPEEVYLMLALSKARERVSTA